MNGSEDRRSTIPCRYGNHTEQLLENFVVRCDQRVPLSQISSSNAEGDLERISVSGVEKKGMVVEKKGRRLSFLIAGAVFSAVAITAVFVQSESNDGSAPTRKGYLPEYTASGDLLLPMQSGWSRASLTSTQKSPRN
jgi:hypothetical protein